MKMLIKGLTAMFYVDLLVWASQSPYQVSIWLKPQIGYPAKHLCNGAIVHERLILTTASCTYLKSPGSNINYRITVSNISIVAGDLTFSCAKVIRDVISIKLATGFDIRTMNNDLALLTLNQSLPLANRTDIKWIILDDHDHLNHSCMANFYTPMANIDKYEPIDRMMIKDNSYCKTSANFTLIRNYDICSSYILKSGEICDAILVNLENSSARGTALVCNSTLYGLLSTIIPPKNYYNVNCSVKQTFDAYYSRVGLHLNWIYKEIAAESYGNPTNLNNTIAPPFILTTNPPMTTPATRVRGKEKNRAISTLQSSVNLEIVFLILCIGRLWQI